MQKDMIPAFFAGASTPNGFVSYFGDLYDPKLPTKTYILKGGPGTGKSTLMKKMAKKLDELGEKYELFYCSSDPKSLDAIRIAKNGTVILDGTAPHTLDPLFPGASEVIVNLGECFDADIIFDQREDILRLSNENQKCHRETKRYISAAGSLLEDSLSLGLICTDLSRAGDFAGSFCKKILPSSNKNEGKEKKLFLSAVTPFGVTFFAESITALAKDVFVIDDRLGAASGIIISAIKSDLLNKGYDVLSFTSPLISGKTDHIVVPKLDLAVCTENDFCTGVSSTHRRIHASRFLNKEALNEHRSRLSFNKKAAKILLENASTLLKKANEIHRELEGYYIDATDYKKLDKMTDTLFNKILSEI